MSLKRLQVGNNGRASLSGSIGAAALSLNLYENSGAVLDDSLAGIPSGTGIAFIITIENEIILCAARTGAAVTVYEEDTHALGFLSAGQNGRGFESTSAASHDADKQAECRNTKRLYDSLASGIEDAETALAARYTKTEIEALLASKNTKDPCECKTTANITLSGEQTLDGILTSTDRVLVTEQTAPEENGIYVSAAGAWARASDMDASAEFNAALVPVKKGTSNADTLWMQTADDPVVDTDAISFSDISVVLEKASEAEAEAGVNDTKYTTVDKVVHLLGNLVNTVHTYFTNTRAAKTTPVDADSVMICDSADSSKDKKMTVANLRKSAKFFVGNSSRVNGAGAGDQAITGVGFTPRLVMITASYNESANSISTSQGSATGAGGKCVMTKNGEPSHYTGVDTGQIIELENAASGSWEAVMKTLDADGFTLTWTPVSESANVNFVYTCFA